MTIPQQALRIGHHKPKTQHHNIMIKEGGWRHDKIDGNAASHIKSAILGPSETIPIKSGGLQLGTWQSPMFVELDGPTAVAVGLRYPGKILLLFFNKDLFCQKSLGDNFTAIISLPVQIGDTDRYTANINFFHIYF